MAKIFITGYANSSSTAYLEVDVNISPVDINGVLYGGLDNPFPYIQKREGYTSVSKITVAPDSDVYVDIGVPNNSSATASNTQTILMIEDTDFDRVNSFSRSPISRVNPVIISGKRRFNSIIGSTTLKINANGRSISNGVYSIPLTFSYQNTIYSGLKITNLSDGSNTLTLDRFTFFNASTKIYETLNLANAIIDFGDVGQPIPPDINTWLDLYTSPIYPYSYTIKDFTGENILSSITDSPSMNKARLSVVGKQKTLTLDGTNGKTYTLVWSSETPEGKQFLGLSNKPNSNRVVLPANSSISVSWLGDYVLYEAYGAYRPPAATFDINLYQNTAEVNRVDKGNYLVGVGTLSGALRDECSLTSPVITIELNDMPSFNYVYIDKFLRWYYVTDITSLRANLWAISLSVDVLMTYKDGIYNCSAFIDRNEEDYDPLIVDNKLPLKQGQTITEYTLNNSVFTDGTGQFLLTGVLVSQGAATNAQTLSDVTEEGFELISTVEETVEEISEESEVQDNAF